MNIKTLLEDIKNGNISIKEGESILSQLPYETIGDSIKFDHHRSLRNGFPEVVFCEGKSSEQLIHIYKNFMDKNEDILGTRCSQAQYEEVSKILPQIQYHPTARTLKLKKKHENIEKIGKIVLCTGGTSDIPVALEAQETAEFFGHNIISYHDVGVAGIHRLFAHLEEIRSANCIIAVAGMEGALPGVLAGLVAVPVIAVPTSVGYGANFQGIAPLLTMLNSCAEGITVVNIDNGFGAAYSACQMNLLATKPKN